MTFEVIPNQQTPKVTLPPIVRGSEDLEKLIAFLEFAKTCHNAVGLAANQCSLDGERFMKRVFALRDLKTDSWQLIIDPVINHYIGINDTMIEGCLTWKGRVIVAERFRKIDVSYWDMDHKVHLNEIHQGFEGQIWQHEINHLNGVVERVEDPSYANVIPKPLEAGRNEKCPCGSGKKYKHCCLILE